MTKGVGPSLWGWLILLFLGRPMVALADWDWQSLPDLPNSTGVAGPLAGVHRDALLVAGGANFPSPVWENDKQWLDQIHVLVRWDGQEQWLDGGRLHRPLAYAACASTKFGVVCVGGNDSQQVYSTVSLLKWDPEAGKVQQQGLPDLPVPSVYGSATAIGDVVYVATGQAEQSLDSAQQSFWSLDLAKMGEPDFQWRRLPDSPGENRAFAILVAQHNGFRQCLYWISGRRQVAAGADDERGSASESNVQFLTDVWEYDPEQQSWRARADIPQCVMAGTGVAFGQSHILVISGADGTRFHRTNELRDQHPGFPKQSWLYHSITNTWVSAGKTPANQVTTTAIPWGQSIVLPSGEVRPRVRSPHVWQIQYQPSVPEFGAINYWVLAGYLMIVLGVGLYFARRNRSTDDYFRGGRHIPWWAAGCSIFATMLSSLTFTGIPSKAYAQDWVYSIGNFLIPVVAIVAVLIAMPFFRRINATSAYEYLELRFGRPVRLFGSFSFMVFHVFRMGIVMSLTGLALAVATPLDPVQSVLLMGLLSVIYCTLGGIEAVIWTDTLQTFVLLGGAVIALVLMVAGVDGGWSGLWQLTVEADKGRLANWHWDMTSSQLAFWVVIVGALAQNVSSYTADQAVVQRYVTTATQKQAGRAIWTNAVLSIPATILFFGLGTALFAYYHSHPDRLEPQLTTDQIFPMFIAREMPMGLAGLIVAGIFAAAQSTVSTSMNSTSTTIVTDFLKPLSVFGSDRGYLRAAQVSTVMVGLLGTGLGLVFIDPEIRSLFDAFIKVIGLIMGVLGGLFVLGTLSHRANTEGAMVGACGATLTMIALWQWTSVNGYLYPAVAIGSCVVLGWSSSWLFAEPDQQQLMMTLWSPMADREQR